MNTGLSEEHPEVPTDILAGLLEFYSSKAVSHASFFVAATFGTYAVLFGGSNLPKWLFTLVYIALLLIGIYAFLDFSYYTVIADTVRSRLEGKYSNDIHKNIDAEVDRHFIFRVRVLGSNIRLLVLFVIWFVAVVLPFAWIFIYGSFSI